MPSGRNPREPDPVTEGELAGDAARVIGAAIRVALFTLPVLLLVTAWYRTPRESFVLALLLGVVLALHLLLRAGHARAALYGLVAALVAYGVGAVVAYGSMRSVGSLAFVAAIVVGGIFLPPAALAAVTAACIAAIGTLTWIEHSGSWPHPDFRADSLQWIAYAVVLSAIAFIMYFSRSLVLAALRRARAEVTERERAQAALRESEQRFRSTFELAGSGIAHVDPPSGRFLRVNRSLCAILGYPEEELLRRTVKELSHPEDRDLTDAERARVGSGELDAARFEKRYLRKDGSIVWVRLSVAMHFGGDAAPLYEVAVFDDVTERKRAEAALRSSEERWERMFRSSPAPMTIGDFDRGVLLDMNRSAEMHTGLSRDDAVGRPLSIFYPDPVEREVIRRRLESEGRLTNYPTTYRRPGDGRLIDTITSLELVQDGERRLSLAVIVDVSEEKRARAALQRSEERFSKAFFSLPFNLAITRGSDGTYLEVNDPPEQSLGYRREELVGRTIAEMGIWPDEAERARALARLAADGHLIGYAARLRHKSGEIADCEIWATQIELDGEPCVLSSTLNVTERKRQEALILEVARGVAGDTDAGFFRKLVEHFARAVRADSVAVGEIVGGPRMKTLALLQDGEIRPGIDYPLEGTACEAVIRTEGLRTYLDGAAQLFPRFDLLQQVGARGYIGAALRDDDGTAIGVLAAAFRQPLADTGGIEPLFRIFAARAQAELLRLRRDRVILGLNETLEQRVRERTRQLEAAVHELEAFSYSVSHDLRAPLRAIVSFVHMLIDEDGTRLSDEGRRKLDVVERNALRMGRLIDELMQLARVQRAEVRREHLDMRSMAAALVEELRPRYPATRVDIGELPAAHGDPTLVPQVFANLLDNAFKFSERAGAPQVELGWSEGERAWYVRDNGIGFDMQYAGKLFGTFERLHSERDYPGTGIGLAIVKRIVERHGGRAWAVAEPGRGAAFHFTLEEAGGRGG